MAGERTRGQVVLFGTCYGNWNEPRIGEDLAAVFEHNAIAVRLAPSERCCGMPRLELGDLDSVEKAKNENIEVLAPLVDEGFDIVAPVPSCVLMFKQELPLMFPGDEGVAKVKAAIFDPFEYLAQRHREGLLRTDFRHSLGTVAYHAACHQRVQNIGSKTPRCARVGAGHSRKRDRALLRARRDLRCQARKLFALDADRPPGRGGGSARRRPTISEAIAPWRETTSPTASGDGRSADHPLTLLRKAYGV